jgi:hypothetical protein
LGASGGGGLAGWDAFFKVLKKGNIEKDKPWREQVTSDNNQPSHTSPLLLVPYG